MKTRNYRFKKPLKTFLCALCGSSRELRFKSSLSIKNYFQIITGCTALALVLSPWFAWKGICLFPLIWLSTELVMKSMYRKELKCPDCGFDPVWYCKDVKVAKQKVENFWDNDNPSE